jgi:hypothetical protein
MKECICDFFSNVVVINTYSRTCLKQYCWDWGVNIELERLLN